jgi:electron transfer flavoprotein-quinone oxidoreductase
MSNAFYREGSNLALAAAKLAADTCVYAHDVGDFSARTLRRYADLLDTSFVMKDLRLYSRTSSYFQSKSVFLNKYPDLLAGVAHELFSVDSIPKQDKQRRILRKVLADRGPLGIVRDAVGAFRALT